VSFSVLWCAVRRPKKAGELIALDWPTKRVLHRVADHATDPPVHDPTRAGRRGGRGIILLPDELSWQLPHLHGFDTSASHRSTIYESNFAGVHELKLVDDGIWGCSTRWARSLKVGFDGKSKQEWWAHEDPVIRDKLAAPPLTVDKSGTTAWPT